MFLSESQLILISLVVFLAGTLFGCLIKIFDNDLIKKELHSLFFVKPLRRLSSDDENKFVAKVLKLREGCPGQWNQYKNTFGFFANNDGEEEIIIHLHTNPTKVIVTCPSEFELRPVASKRIINAFYGRENTLCS